MLNKIKRYIILDCVIFTVMSVILGVFYSAFNTLSEDGAFYLNISMEHFAVATTISLLFFLINLIMEKIEGIKSHLIALCIVIGTVFIEGGWLFHWFPINSYWTLGTLIIIAIIYLAVYFIMFARNIGDSNRINRKLREMREKESE